jgi:hypothetical protein
MIASRYTYPTLAELEGKGKLAVVFEGSAAPACDDSFVHRDSFHAASPSSSASAVICATASAHAPLTWEHVNPCGRFELDMTTRLPLK